jgi:hypothetical protein
MNKKPYSYPSIDAHINRFILKISANQKKDFLIG